MTRQIRTPTCQLGFYKPETRGCPTCGPHGPCTVDPDGLLEDQRRYRDATWEMRITLLILSSPLWIGALLLWWLA